jgi:hypothetical protein
MSKHAENPPASVRSKVLGAPTQVSVAKYEFTRPRYSEKAGRERARLEILALWPDWAQKNLAGRVAKDNDAHAFLRFVRKSHPELFNFKGGLSPYESAFFWVLGAGFVAY